MPLNLKSLIAKDLEKKVGEKNSRLRLELYVIVVSTVNRFYFENASTKKFGVS